MALNVVPHQLPLNTYNNLGPIKNLEVKLQLPSNGIVMAGYQVSLELSAKSDFVSKLNINGQYEESTTVIEGRNYYLSQYRIQLNILKANCIFWYNLYVPCKHLKYYHRLHIQL